MHATRIKICGVMRSGDAALACRAGAHAVGMIFHPPSRRNISPDQARAIVASLTPFVTPVGVFVDASSDTIRRIAGQVGLQTVQLHGHEPPEQVAELAAAPLRVLKALRVDDSIDQQLELWRSFVRSSGALAGIVLETASSAPGGSGLPNDWNAVQQRLAGGAFADLPPVIAAGGLNPHTVADVVRTIRPFAVDVSSGVEDSSGQKSPDLIHRFIRAVRSADTP